MGYNCILLYGNSFQHMSKYAGTFRVASELRSNGFSTQCIDITAFNGFNDELKNVISSIVDQDTLWIGVSTTFLTNIFNFPYARTRNAFNKRFLHNEKFSKQLKEFVNFVKTLNPNIQLIAGGSRSFLVEPFGFKTFNFYSDVEIVEFSQQCQTQLLSGKYTSSLIQGSEFKDFNKSQIIFDSSDIIDSFDTLPIEISRGCIFRCKFCAFPMNGKTKGDWIKNSEVLVDEFNRNYDAFGVTDYVFSDDTYNDSVDKVKSLYDEVFSKLKFKINFTTYLRLDLMVRFPETAEYLKESGLKSALFGIETINHLSGKAIGKGLDPIVQFEYLKELKQNEFKNVLAHSGFILGLPHDTEEDIFKLEEFLFSDANTLDHYVVSPLTITPKEISIVGNTYYSEFDIDYKKYGYECFENISENAFADIQWVNNNTGLSFAKASEHSNRLNKKIETSNKFKFGSFKYPYLRSLGMPEVDLINMSIPEIKAKFNIQSLVAEKKKNYKNNLWDSIKNTRST